MMRIDLQVTFGFYNQIDFAVLAQVRKHMVEKADSRIYLVSADTVQVELDKNLRLFCLSSNLCTSLCHKKPLILIKFP